MYEFQGDELEKYEVELREILDKAVADRIGATLSEVVTLREQTKRQCEIMVNLRKEIDRLKYEREKDILVKAKEVEAETKRQFAAGFNVNDEVYVIDATQSRKPCGKCFGNGKTMVDVLGKTTEVRCPHCSYGSVITNYYSPRKSKIESIVVTNNLHRQNSSKNGSGVVSTKVTLYIDRNDYGIDVNLDNERVFHTVEECQLECDKRNSPNTQE